MSDLDYCDVTRTQYGVVASPNWSGAKGWWHE